MAFTLQCIDGHTMTIYNSCMVNKSGDEMSTSQTSVNCAGSLRSEQYVAWEDDVTNRIGLEFEATALMRKLLWKANLIFWPKHGSTV